MSFSDISIWYYILALLLFGATAMLFALIDRRTMRQLLKISGILLAALAGVAIIAWNNSTISHWLTLALLVLLLFGAHAVKAIRCGLQTYKRSRLHTREHYEYMMGNGATRLEALMPSVRRALRATLMPILRLWSRPLTAAPLLLLLGMLLCGTNPFAAAVATLLTALTFTGVIILATVGAIWLLER